MLRYRDLASSEMGKKMKEIKGGALNDTLYSFIKGKSKVYGLEGDDTLWSRTEASDYLYGGDGNDRLQGSSYSSLLSGGEGDDDINSRLPYRKQVIRGDNGNDDIRYQHERGSLPLKGKGMIVIDGGEGNDTIDVSSDGSATRKIKAVIYAGAGDDNVTIRDFKYEDRFTYDLGAGDDTLTLWRVPEPKDSIISGGDGFDTIKTNTYNPNLWNYLSEVRAIDASNYALVFRAYQRDGIGYEQVVKVPGFEAIINNYTKQYLLSDLAMMGTNIQWT